MTTSRRHADSLPELIETLYESYWITLARLVDADARDVCGISGFITGRPDPLLNGVIGHRGQASDASVGDVLDFFVEQSLPMSWRLLSPDLDGPPAAALTDRGMILAERAVSMSVDLVSLRPVRSNRNLTIRRVQTLEDLRVWIDVLARGFPLSQPVARFIHDAESRRLREGDPAWINYLAVVDDQPVSTLSLQVSHGVGALFNAARIPGKARAGCGPSHLMKAVEDARDLGIQYVALHACPKVERFCGRLGFRRHGTIDTYVATPEWLKEFERIKRAIGDFAAHK